MCARMDPTGRLWTATQIASLGVADQPGFRLETWQFNSGQRSALIRQRCRSSRGDHDPFGDAPLPEGSLTESSPLSVKAGQPQGPSATGCHGAAQPGEQPWLWRADRLHLRLFRVVPPNASRRP